MPELPEFGPGFTRLPSGARYAGADSKDAATRTLREADQSLNERIASAGFGAALADRAIAVSRLHRPGVTPIVGPTAIRAWAATNATAMSAVATAAEAAQSGDLGYTYGTYAVTAPAAQHGAYVRAWTRDASGAWFVAADVAQPAR